MMAVEISFTFFGTGSNIGERGGMFIFLLSFHHRTKEQPNKPASKNLHTQDKDTNSEIKHVLMVSSRI